MPAVVIPRTRPPDWPPYWRFVLSRVSEKSLPMRIIWHVLAVVNAAVWFGAGLFLTVVVGPNFFSPAVTDLVGRQNAGLIAQSVLAKLVELNRQRYAITTSAEERPILARQFGMLHGVSQVGNLLVLIGALAHLVILAHGPQAGRSCDSTKPNP